MNVDTVNPAYLKSNPFVDSAHPAVVAYADEHCDHGASELVNVVHLYYAIRDGFRYNPWGVQLRRAAFQASHIVTRRRALGGHCIDKANLLAACARVIGVPSRLHFVNVRNHIGTEELERQLGTDLLVFHGYAELHLEGRWVAATPAFNRSLCEHLGVPPLEFNGREDSMFQQYDPAGRRYMEYIHDYGSFADIPFELMIAEWARYYPPFGGAGWPERPQP